MQGQNIMQKSTEAMGVDHVDRGICHPTFWNTRDVMCFVPLLFRETNTYYDLDLLNNSVLAHRLDI